LLRAQSFEQCAVVGHSVCELSNFAQPQRKMFDMLVVGRSGAHLPKSARHGRDISSRLRKVMRTGKPVIPVPLFDPRSRRRFLPHESQGLQIAGTRRQFGSSIGSAAANAGNVRISACLSSFRTTAEAMIEPDRRYAFGDMTPRSNIPSSSPSMRSKRCSRVLGMTKKAFSVPLMPIAI